MEHTRNRRISGACLLFGLSSSAHMHAFVHSVLFPLGYQEISIGRILSHQLCPGCVGGGAAQRSETNPGPYVLHELKLFTVQRGLHAMISP